MFILYIIEPMHVINNPIGSCVFCTLCYRAMLFTVPVWDIYRLFTYYASNNMLESLPIVLLCFEFMSRTESIIIYVLLLARRKRISRHTNSVATDHAVWQFQISIHRAPPCSDGGEVPAPSTYFELPNPKWWQTFSFWLSAILALNWYF